MGCVDNQIRWEHVCSSSRSSGGSEGGWDEVIDVYLVIGILADYGLVDRGVHWRDMTENEVGVAME